MYILIALVLQLKIVHSCQFCEKRRIRILKLKSNHIAVH